MGIGSWKCSKSKVQNTLLSLIVYSEQQRCKVTNIGDFGVNFLNLYQHNINMCLSVAVLLKLGL